MRLSEGDGGVGLGGGVGGLRRVGKRETDGERERERERESDEPYRAKVKLQVSQMWAIVGDVGYFSV